ncbi:MAG: hypothetical protein A3H44_04045 [Gammaproteobacteria bacterium RIFCSPLOWO2_02_FULL_57_10]|nr:MAG: hypothetical protein A3H44_04045 [Gammaproteobacteria bacterium RIFCSPLOWO2_02_FULL_57_10]
MKKISWLAASLIVTAMSTSVLSTTGYAATESAGDFSLNDHNGNSHQLSRYRHKDALVLVSQSNTCPIPPYASAQLQTLRHKWEDKGVAFMMLNGAGDDASAIKMKAMAQRMDLPILVDASQIVTKTLKLSKSGEFVVLDPEDFSILYRGPFDPKLESSLDNVVGGVAQETITIPATGCDLRMLDAST